MPVMTINSQTPENCNCKCNPLNNLKILISCAYNALGEDGTVTRRRETFRGSSGVIQSTHFHVQ